MIRGAGYSLIHLVNRASYRSVNVGKYREAAYILPNLGDEVEAIDLHMQARLAPEKGAGS